MIEVKGIAGITFIAGTACFLLVDTCDVGGA